MDKTSGFEDGQQTELVHFDRKVKDKQIDMNPPAGQVVEPTTGSSVLVEPEVAPKLPDNGFPAGYGPNAGLKRVEKPKKPSFHERMKRTVKKLTKKQKVVGSLILAVSVLAVVGVVIFVTVSGVFEVDYSGTYAAAKELRGEMQKLKSDASCDKVADYVNNAYTTMQVYQSYVENCKEVGAGVTSEVVSVLGNTEGVLKDEAIARKYETFKLAMQSAKEGNANVNETLDLYTVWHSWIVTESKYDNEYYNWNWEEAYIDEAAEILKSSKNEMFQKYGEEWAERKKLAVKATKNYYANVSTDAHALMTEAQGIFKDWKTEHEPKITKEIPLDMVDTAMLYNKFLGMYDLIRETYQSHYNREVGGCKEMVGSVVCD